MIAVRLAVIASVACGNRAIVDGARTLDSFDDVAAWQATGSEGVTASVHAVPGRDGRALRLAFDLGGTSGYAVARRSLPLVLPADFELAFDLRGELPVNNLEVKLVDASGENVWWFHRRNYAFPSSWRHVVIKRRQIEFAWGPIADHTLREIAAIEVVVSAGTGGGKGFVDVDQLTLRERSVPATPPPAPRATASSSAPGSSPALAIDGDVATAWHSDPAARGGETFMLDFGRDRDLGGIAVRWDRDAFATDYTVELSSDGARWQPVGAIADGAGGLDPVRTPDATARFVRLQLARGRAGFAIAELVVLAPEAGESANQFVAAIARLSPRGSFPRGFSGEQPYWTIVGVDGGGATASLMSEDGAVELRGGASLEPFVEEAGRVTSWATASRIEPSLDGGYLPIPSVTWHAPGWQLVITAVATGDSQLAVRYMLQNTAGEPRTLRLVLAARPFQVNPPTQWLNLAGGVHAIERIAWRDQTVIADGVPLVRPLVPPDHVALWPFHGGGYPAGLPAPTPRSIVDPTGLASGALAYDLALAPHGKASVVVVAPLSGPMTAPTADSAAWFAAALADVRAGWHAKLDRVGFRVPADGAPIVDTLRSSLAYMLLSRDGPILRPGTRSYARAWIRDGAMIGEALLRLGHPDVATAFLRWYAPYQFASGKVPCCVEANGAVPVPENDSHGQLIFLASEVYRYTHDAAQLRALWPAVQAAARYLDELRRSERGASNQTAARRAFYGLLPPSISHEGYSAKPAYSYWDDFWGLTGYTSAANIATALGDDAAAARYTAQADEMRADIVASIGASSAAHHTSYIPGAADLGDFDATSTTIALDPAGQLRALPAALVQATFERAWETLAARHAGGTWTDYTPYELRLIGSFVRLGWRARVHDALAAYLADRRPVAWNQWAEVVGRDAREPRFIGDMPHAWVHSDYARSVLDMFAYERADDHAYVLAAGIPATWFAGDGFAIDRLPTPFGSLSYAVSATDRAITLAIGGGELPSGGLVFPWPLATPPGRATINGKPARWRGAEPELAITERPATIVVQRSGGAIQP